MLIVTATFDLTILYFVAANVICLLSYVLVVKHRARMIQRNVTLVSTTITDYFRENGTEVSVEVISRGAGRRFVALVSSKPSRRFRNSHIVEMALTTHVRKVCGLDLEKVFWCFPVKTRQEVARRDPSPGDAPVTMKLDDYFDEEMSTLSKPPCYRVKEVPLERFEVVADKQKPAARPEPRSEPRSEPWVAAAH